MPKIEIYTKSYCPHCKAAKRTLGSMGLTFEEIEVSDDPARFQEMKQRSQRRTVPQIFVGNTHIGGNSDLMKAIQNGWLKHVLSSQSATH